MMYALIKINVWPVPRKIMSLKKYLEWVPHSLGGNNAELSILQITGPLTRLAQNTDQEEEGEATLREIRNFLGSFSLIMCTYFC